MRTLWLLLGVSTAFVAGAAPKVTDHGEARKAWTALMSVNCDLKQVRVWTPIEARILRNTPFAIQGRVFKTASLSTFFTVDGDWYQPKVDATIALSDAEKACVQKLKKHEDALRQHGFQVSPVQKCTCTPPIRIVRSTRKKA